MNFFAFVQKQWWKFRTFSREELPYRKVNWWVATPLLILASLPLLFLLYLLAGGFGPLPSKDQLRRISQPLASEIYTADGVLIGKYYIVDRVEGEMDAVPANIRDALLATEDIRYYKHGGVDLVAGMRVLIKTLIMGERDAGGGSTISQQLVKNIYPRRSYERFSLPLNKLREMAVACRFEDIYEKEEILRLYLNTVSFGEDCFGITSASRRFFNKRPEQLALEEAAVLVGMLKAPTTYNPRMFPENAILRRNLVIRQMQKYDFIGANAADSLVAIPIRMNYTLLSHNHGMAPYLREYLRLYLRDYFQHYPQPDGSTFNIYTDGLKIYTTLDSRMQVHAEAALETHLHDLQEKFDRHWEGEWQEDYIGARIEAQLRQSPRFKQLKAQGYDDDYIKDIMEQPVAMKMFDGAGERIACMSPMDSIFRYVTALQGAFMAIEPRTGRVVAYVGGGNHKYFKYNHTTSYRQAGSIFKPILYTAALEDGIGPCTYIGNYRRTYGRYENWSPRNATKNYGGSYSLEGALTRSLNVVSASLIMKVGVNRVADFATELGLARVPHVPSIALGAAEVSLEEMVSAYTAFANGGIKSEPVYISRIEDRYGNSIATDLTEPRQRRVISQASADMMVNMLRSVVKKGTARRLPYYYKLTNDIAGKTGTTQDHADGWFIGMTPKLIGGAWVGNDDPRVHFRELTDGQGSRTAMPVYGLFMQNLKADSTFKDIFEAEFFTPEPVLAEMNCAPVRYPQKLAEEKTEVKGESVELTISPPPIPASVPVLPVKQEE